MINLSSLLASGFEGLAATVAVGTTTPVNPNVSPSVTNVGTTNAAIFNFSLPRAPTLTLGSTTTVNPNASPTVSNSGTGGDSIFNFSLPSAPALTIGAVTVVNPSVNPSTSSSTTNGNVTLNLNLPRAPVMSVSGVTVVNPDVSPSVSSVTTNGDVALTFSLPSAPTTTLGVISTLLPGQNPSVTNTGTNGNTVLNIGIPRAAAVSLNATPVVEINPDVSPSVSNSGIDGDVVLQFSIPRAADVSVGTVTTLEPGNSATVSNSGSNGDVVLDFSIPRGPRGVIPRGIWNSATAYDIDDLATYNGATYRRLVAGTTIGLPPVDPANWEIFAAAGAAPTSYVIDNISGHFNGRKTLFDLNVNGASAGVQQEQDLMIVINGKVLTPDVTVNKVPYPWLIITGIGGLGKDYKIINNKLLLYAPPSNGWESYIKYSPTQSTSYITGNYPFSAMTIALGD